MVSDADRLNAELEDEDGLSAAERLVIEALAEDKRCGDGHFDADGWSNFFLEEWKKDPEAVDDAWLLYRKLNHMV